MRFPAVVVLVVLSVKSVSAADNWPALERNLGSSDIAKNTYAINDIGITRKAGDDRIYETYFYDVPDFML